jgi:F0F1-type ATP synthase membrane subunit a
MTEEDSKHTGHEQSVSVYFVALILGSAVSFALATYWLELSPAWLALLVGAVCGLIGSFLGENIGDAIMFSLILSLMVFLFIKSGPEIAIVRAGIVPIATGFCVGKLVYGIWNEIAT